MKFFPAMRNALLTLTAAVCAVLFLLAPSEALGQTAKSTRAPHILQHDGKRFAAYVDEKSETATWIIDTDSLDFNPGNAHSLSSKTSVSTAADAFIDAHAGVFGIDTKQLSEPHVETNGTFWFIGYVQVYEGLRVLGSEVGITITNSGRIVGAGARAFPKLDVQVGAQISKGAAIAFARGQTTIPQTEATVKEDLVIVPEELAERYVFRLAWEVVLENQGHDSPLSKTFLVDAHRGDIIAEYSNILETSSHGQGPVRLVVDEDARAAPDHAVSTSSTAAAIPYALPRVDIPEENIFKAAPPESRKAAPSGTGILSGRVTLNYYESPDTTDHPFTRHYDQPFPFAKVTVQNDATQETHVVYANEDGDYSVPNLADTTHTVTFEIANNKAYIEKYIINSNNMDYITREPTTCEKEKNFSIDIEAGTTTVLNHDWGWVDSGDGGLTAFALNSVYHVREMYEYFSDVNTYSYSGMDSATYKIWIYEDNKGEIDIHDPYYPKNIYLGGPNAMSNEVVFHEFTHDVIYTLHEGRWYWSSEHYAAMHEGFSDYFAADKTNDYTYSGPEAGNTDPVLNGLGTSGVRFLWNSCTMDDYLTQWPCGGSPGLDQRQHNRGRIISGAIWRIRADEDKRTNSMASQLLFTALQMVPRVYAASDRITFEDLRDRYTAADRHTNNSMYAATIEDRFAERRIGGPAIPGGPSIVVESATDYNPEITWSDNSLINEGYLVERQYNDNDWVEVANLAADTIAYVDTSYQCITGGSETNTYSYRIVPYKDYEDGIGIVRTESATVTLSLSDCTTTTGTTRIADASAEVEMTDNVQIKERKVPTSLEAPHPNPFNPVTTIRYGLAEEGPVRLTVYDVLGRRVAVLLDGIQTPGKHTVRFEASHLSSGLYFVILDGGGKTFTKSVLLMK